MINVIVGDTIVFEANLKDASGATVTNAVANLIVVDKTGSTVLTTTAAHQGDGTYQKSQSTTGWNQGPINEYWKFTSSNGTASQIVSGKFRLTGTDTLEPYIKPHELFAYYENVENYFDNSELERVYDSYNFINQQLTTLGYKLPVSKGTDGYYDQALRDWNAWDSIYRIVFPRMVSQIKQDDGKPWFDYFKKRADEKWDEFRSRKVVLNSLSTPGEVGVQPGTKIGGTLYSVMQNNWEGYGNGFEGADFPRTWRLEVISIGTDGAFANSQYRWSMDNGITWEGTQTAQTAWVMLADEVYVRFDRGSSTGTTGLFTTADVWQFNTVPIKLSTGGKGVARSY